MGCVTEIVLVKLNSTPFSEEVQDAYPTVQGNTTFTLMLWLEMAYPRLRQW